MKRIGIVGFGTMGEAFATGIRRKLPQAVIAVFDVKAERVKAAAQTHGLVVAASAAEAIAESELTILCVKPQDFANLASEAREVSAGRRFISILAGKKIQSIAEAFSTVQVARFMPNIAAVKGASLIGISLHPGAAPDLREDSLAIAAALGAPLEIPEKLMSAMTGVSGSGLAYVFSFVHAMALGGVASGFDYPTALRVAVAALEGAASLLKDGTHPMELASRVTSPAGTTIQGVRALERGGFTAAVMEAVEAAARKATELEG
jgi:pyrroline-5-carboxylate reductase